MAIKYRLEFDTHTDENTELIEWRMDISQDSYSGVPMPIIGGATPVTIEYQQDNDIYKPIVGSSAKIDLVVTDTVTYDDFNTGGLREYEVNIYYKEDSNYVLYWRGFMNPVDSSESVRTVPFNVSFTASDYLGLLEQLSISDGDPQSDNGSLFGYIHRGLLQTGCDLPIYVDSKIRNADGDALLNSTSDPLSFQEEEGDYRTIKDSIIGTLATFNCTVRQSYGRWYIFNASTHGGAGDNEETTWKAFSHLGVALPDVVENIRKIVKSDGDLIPANQDLQRNFRRPIGSVEAEPKDLTQIDFVPNSDFEDGATGWNNTGSIESNITLVADAPASIPVSTNDYLTGGNAIYTGRNRHTINTDSEVWFRNTTGFPIELTKPSTLNIDWKYKDGPSSESYKSVRFLYRLRLDIPGDGIDYSNVRLNLINGVTQTQQTGVTTLYYDDVSQRWTDGNNLFGVDTRWNRANAGAEDEWQTTTLELPPALQAADWVNNPSDIPTGSTLTIEVSYPQAQTTGFFEFGDREADGNGMFYTIIDAIRIESEVDSDAENPVYERVQDNFTRTISYEPAFISQGLESWRQRLNQSNFWRDGESSTDQRLLENIITQQKLNDFRERFTYYEGTLISNGAPLGQHHKPKIELSSTFAEDVGCIMNGGSYDLKANAYKVNMYVPNQATDVASTFFDMDVDLLVPEYVPDNPPQEPFIFDYNFTLTQADGSAAASGIEVTPSMSFELFEAPSGTVLTRRLTFNITSGNLLSPASFVVSNTPENVQFGEFFSSGNGSVSVDVIVTAIDSVGYETLEIACQYIVFTPEATPGTVPATVVITNSGSNLAGSATTTYDVSGVPGSTVHFTHHVKAADNFQLFSGNFDASYTDSSLTNNDAVDGVNSVAIDFAYNVPTSTESVAVTVTGNATPAGTIGVDIFTRTVNFGTAPTGTRFHEDSNTFTGVPSSTHDYFITLIPDADKYITSVAAPTLPSGIVANGAPYKAGENWEIPVQVTIGNSNDSLNVTQNAITVVDEPYSVTFNVNNVGIQNAIVGPATHRISFDSEDFGEDITPFTVSVTPTGVFMFDSSSDIQVDINEAQVQTEDGIVVLSEAQFTAAIQPTLNNGAIEILIAGDFPTTGSNYVLDINVVGNSTTGFGASTIQPATTATIRSLTPGISSAGGAASFEVIANGSWNASIAIAGDSDGVNSDNGQFTLSSSSGLLTSTGGYSPTAGIDGTHLIELNVGEEPYYFNPAGPTGTSSSFWNSLSFTISIHARNSDGSDGHY